MSYKIRYVVTTLAWRDVFRMDLPIPWLFLEFKPNTSLLTIKSTYQLTWLFQRRNVPDDFFRYVDSIKCCASSEKHPFYTYLFEKRWMQSGIQALKSARMPCIICFFNNSENPNRVGQLSDPGTKTNSIHPETAESDFLGSFKIWVLKLTGTNQILLLNKSLLPNIHMDAKWS